MIHWQSAIVSPCKRTGLVYITFIYLHTVVIYQMKSHASKIYMYKAVFKYTYIQANMYLEQMCAQVKQTQSMYKVELV